MAGKKSKKQKTYVCVICGKQKKLPRKVKCCSKDMIAQEKGSWNL